MVPMHTATVRSRKLRWAVASAACALLAADARAQPRLPFPLPPAPPAPAAPPAAPEPSPPTEPACSASLQLVNRTASLGLTRFSSTFSSSFVDIDGDGDDDLVVSNHGMGPPTLMINRGGRFAEVSQLLPFSGSRDRHAITVVDLDNDGDRDLLLAAGGGGADAFGQGAPNEAVRNLLVETGELAFEPVPAAAEFSLQTHRSRSFMALPSPAGDKVDLYLLTKRRSGHSNRYFRNRRPDGVRLTPMRVPSLDTDRHTEDGYDTLLDFDGDGLADLLLHLEDGLLLFRNRGDGFTPLPGLLPKIARINTIAAGDLDGDGLPEIFLGRNAPLEPSDELTANAHELHYIAWGQQPDDADGFSFLASDRIAIDFSERPGLQPNPGDTIYIGAGGRHPMDRRATVGAAEAAGRPDIGRPGTYLWHEPATGRWHVALRYAEPGDHLVGIISSESIDDVRGEELEKAEFERTSDVLLRNLGGGGFEPVPLPQLEHSHWTTSAALVDLDNNGWLDIALARGGQQGALNGDSVVLMNCGGFAFDAHPLPNPGAEIYRAGELVFGFADGDARPDLFLTNGSHLTPSNRGPYRMLLNRTPAVGAAVMLELVGTRSNRDAVGARVDLLDDAGRLLGSRLLAYRGRAQDSHRLHFGLGEHRGPVRARIRWPSGLRQTTGPLEPNRLTRIVEPTGAGAAQRIAAAAPPVTDPPGGGAAPGSADAVSRAPAPATAGHERPAAVPDRPAAGDRRHR